MYKNSNKITRTKKYHLGYLGEDGRMRLHWILDMENGKDWNGFVYLRDY
jgi:hypothetical protein